MIDKEILVVKYGSTSVANGNGMDHARLSGYAEQLARLRDTYELVVVSSGSVATGQVIWNEIRNGEDLPGRQSLAMLGSASSHMAWQSALAEHGIPAGQLLLTHREVDDSEVTPFLEQAIQDNFKNGILPILNENDAISIQELALLSYGGDNDGLASHVARKIDAGGLILNTDVEGLFATSGRLVRTVGSIPSEWDRAREFAGSEAGTAKDNGMPTKVEACIEAAADGLFAHIAQAGEDYERILSGEAGTFFVPNPAGV